MNEQADLRIRAMAAEESAVAADWAGAEGWNPGRGDAACFAANAVSFERTILLSSCSETLRARLKERGYRVVETPLRWKAASGGSACCLTLRLDHRSAAAIQAVPAAKAARGSHRFS